MNKLSIKGVLCESVSTWYNSLWDLFKNNWLWILVSLTIFVTTGVVSNLNPGGNLVAAELITKIRLFDNSMSQYLAIAGHWILYFMLGGYAFRRVIENNKNSIGLGGIYLNKPYFKMIASFILESIITFIFIFTAIYIITMFKISRVIMDKMDKAAQIPTDVINSPFPITAMDVIMGVILVVCVVLVIFFLARFITVLPYSFMHNKITILEPFKQTKGNVIRIIVLMIAFVLLGGIVVFMMYGAALGISIMALTTGSFIHYFLSSILLLVDVATIYFSFIYSAVIYKHLTINQGEENE